MLGNANHNGENTIMGKDFLWKHFPDKVVLTVLQIRLVAQHWNLGGMLCSKENQAIIAELPSQTIKEILRQAFPSVISAEQKVSVGSLFSFTLN